MKLLFIIIVASMGTSLARGITEETTIKILNERSKDIARSTNSENGTNKMFADKADSYQSNVPNQSQSKSPLPPYQPGGDKTPYLRGKPNKQTKPDNEENIPRILLLQPVRQNEPFGSSIENTFQPLIETLPFNRVSAQTLPSHIQFDSAAKQPYVAGQNKQQYLRGRQSKPFQADQQDNDTPVNLLLNPVKQTKPYPDVKLNTPTQSLPSPVQFEESQKHLGFNPQIFVQNPLSGIYSQTLPSPIQFDQSTVKQPYVAGQTKQQYLRGRQTKPFQADQQLSYVLLNKIKQTKPFSADILNTFSTQLLPSPPQFEESQENNRYTPQILVHNPVTGSFAQSLPSPIQFDQPAAKQPYVAGQNKQQYLRGRQTKPYQADQQESETPAYFLLNHIKQTDPFPSGNLNSPSTQALQSPIQSDESQENLGFTRQILVQNPVSGIFAQTLPSPIKFDQPAAKQPYIAGQNKQQYLRGRQTNSFDADAQANETPDYILLNPVRQTKPFLTSGQNIISAQTLPSKIQFSEDKQAKPFLTSPSAQPLPPSTNIEHYLNPIVLQTNPAKTTQTMFAAQLPSPAAQASYPSAQDYQAATEETQLSSRVPAGFLSGVSTRPRFPPGYTLPGVTRYTQTPELPSVEYGEPKTVLYIF